jgi:PhzF family phenazine biosynthesis protein
VARELRMFRVDAFTGTALRGNPANVVLGAELLGEAELAPVARELAGGDTAFVLPPRGDDHDLYVRFHTPRGEAPFVGHATLAVHAVLDAIGAGPCPRQQQAAGPIEVTRHDAAGARWYGFVQPPPPLAAPPPALLRALPQALGLDPADLDPRAPPVLGGKGGTRLLVGVRDGAVLAALRPDRARLLEIALDGGPQGIMPWTLKPAVSGCDTEARMYCPAIGIEEDPVSGNAHAMLAAHLHALGLCPQRATGAAFRSRQGHHIGRDGLLEVQLTVRDGCLALVRISGTAVVVVAGALRLPPEAA